MSSGSLRVVSWNCADSFHTKAERLRELDADIVIVCEVREAHAAAIGKDWTFIWHGEPSQRGLLIAARRPWRLELIKTASRRHMALVHVSNDQERLSIVGVWAMPHYVKSVITGLDELSPELTGGQTIVAGDFNAAPRFDATLSAGFKFAQITDRMNRLGLQSLWHTQSGQAFGEELTPTYHHQWQREQPFHIDYVFASNDMRQRLKALSLGHFDEWCTRYSDHVPVVADYATHSANDRGRDQVNAQDWIGRSETAHDLVARDPFQRLAALLDRAPESSAIPPMGHLLCFLPQVPQSEVGPDGHPLRGGIVPPINLPMRMAAGSRITFHAPIPFGADIRRVTTIANISEKTGRTGRLAFLTLRHDIFAGDILCVTDEADIVFREKSGNAQPLPPGERREAQVSRTIDPTAALLFRYSALTYNAHRIHYDRDYAMQEEGYPGLVVHGPLLATLLVDHFRRHRPHDKLATFQFRAQRPVFDLAPFTVNLVDTESGADVWAADAAGYVAMSGRIAVA